MAPHYKVVFPLPLCGLKTASAKYWVPAEWWASSSSVCLFSSQFSSSSSPRSIRFFSLPFCVLPALFAGSFFNHYFGEGNVRGLLKN